MFLLQGFTEKLEQVKSEAEFNAREVELANVEKDDAWKVTVAGTVTLIVASLLTLSLL